MTGPGGATLSYKIFTDAATTTNWGDTTATEVSGTGSTTITVYARIVRVRTSVPGTYTDTMTTATTSFTVTAVGSGHMLDFGEHPGLRQLTRVH